MTQSSITTRGIFLIAPMSPVGKEGQWSKAIPWQRSIPSCVHMAIDRSP
jgi:hypothetical protein